MAGRMRRNGRRGRRVGLLVAGAASALTLLAPGAASAEVLHNQIDPTSPESTTSQDFEAEFNEYDSVTADDFTVPAGQVWQLESGLIRGKGLGTSTTSTVNVRLYRDAGGLPGAPILTGQLQAPGYPRFQLPLSAVPDLAAGHYWLSVQAVLTRSASVTRSSGSGPSTAKGSAASRHSPTPGRASPTAAAPSARAAPASRDTRPPISPSA